MTKRKVKEKDNALQDVLKIIEEEQRRKKELQAVRLKLFLSLYIKPDVKTFSFSSEDRCPWNFTAQFIWLSFEKIEIKMLYHEILKINPRLVIVQKPFWACIKEACSLIHSGKCSWHLHLSKIL